MSRKASTFVLTTLAIVLTIALAMPAAGPAPVVAQDDPVTVTWFVGLGTGGQEEQVAAQEAVVEAFNQTVGAEKGINLELVIANNDVAYDTLSTLIATGGGGADIVGPVGVRGSNAFEGNWLDLQPLVDEMGYDLSQFPEALVDFYRVEGQGLIGLPFGTFPAMTFYNRDLFDAAGLPYPPQTFGEPYADGEPWDYDKLTELALQMTLDADGNDATSADFDPDNIVQFGFVNQWTELTRMATQFGAGSFVGEDGQAVMPEHWAEYFRWYYDGMWSSWFIPNAAYTGSDLLAAGNPFDSGNVAMANTHLWYTCCINPDLNWDLAVVPSYNGVYTAALHADTFRIVNNTPNPEATFEVLTYLIGEAAGDLLQVYGGMPARDEEQPAFFDGLDETYDQGVNWQVAVDSLNFPDNPNHEAWTPNFQKAYERAQAFQTLMETTPDLDLEAEMDTLITDLQAIFDEVAEE